MAGPAFKKLAAAIKADILQDLKRPGRRLVDRGGLEDDGLTLAGYIDYHLVKPLFNLREDQPSKEQLTEAVDKVIAKAFTKDSQARNDFKKTKVTDSEIDNIIKNRLLKFKEDYQPMTPKWQAASATVDQPKVQVAKSKDVVMGRREPLTPRRNSNDQPPSRPLPADPIKKGAVLQTGRPLPTTPAKKDFSKPPAKELPPDPIVGGNKPQKNGP